MLETVQKSLEGRRILVVEDEVRLAEMIAQGLGDEGHPVTAVHTGEEALDHATVTDFDELIQRGYRFAYAPLGRK